MFDEETEQMHLGMSGHAPKHLVAALLAFAISIGFHAVALQYFPDLSINVIGPPSDDRSYKTFELTPEDHNTIPDRKKPDALSDPDLEILADLSEEIAKFESTVEALLPLPDIKTEQRLLEGESPPTTAPEAPELTTEWEARQDIVMIDKKLFEDHIPVIERSFVPNIPRIDKQLDITLPTTAPSRQEMAAALENTAPRLTNIRTAELGALIGPSINPLDTIAVPDGDLLGDPKENEVDLVDEPPEEVVKEVKAMENLLGFQISQFTSPADPGYVYFKVEITRAGAEALPVLPKDVVFLQDCSESMTSYKLAQCKKGLLRAIKTLGPDDRFNVLGFRDSVESCFPNLTANSASTRARAKWFVEGLKARGKTDVNASLGVLLDHMDPRQDRPLIAVLVTDGRPTMGLVDSSEIIEAFTRRNKRTAAMFAVGGGRRANKYLLDLVSYRNRGDSLVVRDRDGIPAALGALATQLSRPVLQHLEYRFSGIDNAEVYPRALTDLYLDRPLVLYGRAPRGIEPIAFQILGSGTKTYDFIHKFSLAESQADVDAIRYEWAEQKMFDLIGEYSAKRDAAILEEMKSLSLQYGVNVPYAYDLNAPIRPVP